MIPTSKYSCRQKCGNHKGKDLGCTEDVEVFSRQSLKLNPHQIAVWRRAFSCKRWFRPTAFQGHTQQTCVFQHPQPPRNEPHLSALLWLPPFPMLGEHTLYNAYLQSNKETTVWICAYRYVTTVLSAFARNVFYGGCSLLIWLPLILGHGGICMWWYIK